MNCKRCGSQLRIAPEQVAVDKQGMPIYHRFGYCDNCRMKYDMESATTSNTNQKKKNSTLSVIAAVLGLFGCTVFIGAIIGIVDLCQNDKTKKHLGSWFAIISSIIVLIVAMLAGLDGKDNDEKETPKTSVQYTGESKSDKSDDLEFMYEKMNVKYIGYKIENNLAGKECLVLYFDFTNESNKNQTFVYSFAVNAFQNGVELDDSFVHVNEETKNSNKEILPGTTLRVAESFIMPEDKSNILVEVKPLISLSNEKLLQLEIQIK